MTSKEPIRILIVDGKLICGGVESFLMNIYRHIDRTKVQFDFLVHYKERFYYDDEIESMGGKIYRLSFRNDNNYFKYKKDLKEFFLSHPEYSIVWGHMDGLASIYLSVAKQCGIKTTICHSHITQAENSFKGLLKRCLRKNVWKYCDYMFACSTEAGKYLFGNHPFHLVNNAIEIDKFSFDNRVRSEIRNKYHWESKVVIGHIGRFFPQKNHSFLIDIFDNLVKTDEDFVLCLCGDGEDKKMIEELCESKKIKDKVYFMGNVKNAHDYFQAFDIFVMPSLYEGLPVTGVEAQTSSLKCIFSDTITQEVNLVRDNVEFLPIGNDAVDKWVDAIKKNKVYNRVDCSETVINRGYSIDQLANKILTFVGNNSHE